MVLATVYKALADHHVFLEVKSLQLLNHSNHLLFNRNTVRFHDEDVFDENIDDVNEDFDDDEDVNAGHPPEAKHGDEWDKV